MLVHIESTAIHVLDVKIENKTETQLFKANGVFLNFAKEPIRVYFETYVPKNNSDWHATTSFSSDDILEISGTITDLNDVIIIVGIEIDIIQHLQFF